MTNLTTRRSIGQIETHMEVLRVTLTLLEAKEIVADCDFGEDRRGIDARDAALVMLCRDVPPIAFREDDIAWVESVQSRLWRDGVWVGASRQKLVRAQWLEEPFSLLLDAMVGSGDVRRSWAGLYHSVTPEPWRKEHVRAAALELLTNRSATTTDIARELQAEAVPNATRSSVHSTLIRLERDRVVGRVPIDTGRRGKQPSVWTRRL